MCYNEMGRWRLFLGDCSIMQFWQYRTTRANLRALIPDANHAKESIRDFYAGTMAFSAAELHSAAALRQQLLEGWWEIDRCPYYRVYPSIIPMLLRLNLNFDAGLVKLPPPMRTFAVHFPKAEHQLSFDDNGSHYLIRSLMFGPVTLQVKQQQVRGISIWTDFGETLGMAGQTNNLRLKDFPLLSYINMPVEDGVTVEVASNMLLPDPGATFGIMMPPQIKSGIIKLICTLCLLEHDPAIIEPDVLDKDRAKYEAHPDQAIVDRAIRRGKVGWNVGRKIEVMPHVRGPSPLALYWTGKGRAVPLIRYRKGCIVHRELIGKVSTIQDYDEQQEIEKEIHLPKTRAEADDSGKAGISGSVFEEAADISKEAPTS